MTIKKFLVLWDKMKEIMANLPPLVALKDTGRNICLCLGTIPAGLVLGLLLIRYGVHKEEIDKIQERQERKKQ